MRLISNSDYSFILRVLADFAATPAANLRESNERRLARNLLRKLTRNTNKNLVK